MDLQAVADRLEIIEVCTRLHWCVDHRDWDGLDDLLADQVSFPTPAEMSAPGFDPARYRRSRAEVKAAYPGLLKGLITQHLIGSTAGRPGSAGAGATKPATTSTSDCSSGPGASAQ